MIIDRVKQGRRRFDISERIPYFRFQGTLGTLIFLGLLRFLGLDTRLLNGGGEIGLLGYNQMSRGRHKIADNITPSTKPTRLKNGTQS